MAKFFGVVGYGQSTQGNLGVWRDSITERQYYGDVVRNARRLEANAELNDDVSPDASISIMADPYANEHFFAIRFVEWSGAVWKVTSVDSTQRPRLILRLGGVYNGPRADASGATSPAP